MHRLVGTFTIPDDVPDRRVVEKAKELFVKPYYESYFNEGWRLKTRIRLGKAVPLTEDIENHVKRFQLSALWERAPILHRVDVKDSIIPKLLEDKRFQLVE
uniref:Uncharacterized protein n=1 Tax=viral metagenome TaxID=1070528 RepID=A0A6H1ZFX3_9ZZZZ